MGEAKRRRERIKQTDVERTDFKVNPPHCPHCAITIDIGFCIQREDDARAMDPGTLMICHACTKISISDTRGQLLKITESMVQAMDPAQRHTLVLVIRELRRRKLARGELTDASPDDIVEFSRTPS